MMKKTILLSLLALVTLTFSTTVLAATTGTLTLQGIIGEILSITVTPEPAASALDLETTQVDLKVGTVSEVSNSATGYQVTVSSANDGSLIRSGGSESIAYTLKYSGVLINLSGSSSSAVQATSVTTGGPSSIDNEVSISYTGAPAGTLTAGTYQDTLTFEIAAH